MRKNIIVTAFFQIDREKWTSYARSDSSYFEHFRFWCGIKNKLIVYTSPDLVERVRAIRSDNIEIIPIKNVYEIDRELYESIKKVTRNDTSRMFRVRPNSPESWNDKYVYIMMLKTWFLFNASTLSDDLNERYIWMDFGYNHGNEYYINSEEFNFNWDYEFSNKINVFNLYDLDYEKPIFEICRSMDTYMMGSPFVVPKELTLILKDLCREAMITLNRCGLVDDDQTIMLMVLRENKELFDTHKENWNTVLKNYAKSELTLNSNFGMSSLKNKLKSYLYRKKNLIRYICYWYKELSRNAEKE